MAKKVRPRSAGKVDIDMGQRIKVRRTEIGMSQGELAEKLGVSFQQVQKYEKGVNRVGASRLQLIADALEVPVTYFYESPTKGRSDVESLLFLDPRFWLRLLRAYSSIKNVGVQRNMVTLMEHLAEIDSPED